MKNIKFSHILYSFMLILWIIALILGHQIYLLSTKTLGVQHSLNIKKTNITWNYSGNKNIFIVEPVPNITEKWDSTWLENPAASTINSDTLNERYEYPLIRENNVFRIVTIGDSFTYGVMVDTKDNYPELLEDLLNSKLYCNNTMHFDVINLGMHNYDIEYASLRLQTRGLKYDPDLIIWLWNSINFTKIDSVLLPLEEKLQKEGYAWFDPTTKSYPIPELATKILFEKFTKDEIIAYQKEILSKITQYYNKNLLVLTFPEKEKWYEKIALSFIKENPRYNHEVLFDYWNMPELHLMDGHPNKKGYTKIAESIFNYLNKTYFKTCKKIE